MNSVPFTQLPNLELPLLNGGEHDCSYLPGRTACELCTFPALGEIDATLYETMMNMGFRRAGQLFYKPHCPSCRECVPIRVPVDRFSPSKSQRRTIRRNQDLIIHTGPAGADDEHYELYLAYQMDRHDERAPAGRVEFDAFLGSSPIASIELALRLDRRLVCVSVIDVCPNALSSVYCYYDPRERDRSLGTLSALFEIQLCRAMKKPWWYIGFYVSGCEKMEYKRSFRPCELLGEDSVWREAR